MCFECVYSGQHEHPINDVATYEDIHSTRYLVVILERRHQVRVGVHRISITHQDLLRRSRRYARRRETYVYVSRLGSDHKLTIHNRFACDSVSNALLSGTADRSVLSSNLYATSCLQCLYKRVQINAFSHALSSQLSMATMTALSLKPFARGAAEETALKDVLARVNLERGHFRHITEASLQAEAAGDGALELSESDDEDEDEGKEDVDLVKGRPETREDLFKAKVEMLQHVGAAEQDILMALDYVSLLMSKDRLDRLVQVFRLPCDRWFLSGHSE